MTKLKRGVNLVQNIFEKKNPISVLRTDKIKIIEISNIRTRSKIKHEWDNKMRCMYGGVSSEIEEYLYERVREVNLNHTTIHRWLGLKVI